MREEFAKRVLAKEKSKAALCREYGISRPTGDKWLGRYLSGEKMSDNSRAPREQGNQTPPEMEERIVSYRKKYPAIGALKLQRMLKNEGEQGVPCAKTINNIIKRNGLITREASLAAKPCQRFEKPIPNEMWQADYKGHFALHDGNECHPLNITDDRNRYCLCCQPMRGETYAELRPVMKRVFEEYGMPRTFLCDNGNPWGTVQSTGYTRFEVWLMELGVLTIHGRIRHPQTQGKDERFNRSFTRECLGKGIPENMDNAEARFSEYRNFYNQKRPHYALKLEVPASVYTRSERAYSEDIRRWEYDVGCEVRKVKSTGFVTYGGQGYFLSEAFGGKEIAIKRSHLPGQITLLFRQFRIGRIDVERRVFTTKRAYLINGDPR